MTYVGWCPCGRYLLTTEQLATDQLCDKCREEQIEDLPDKKEEEK